MPWTADDIPNQIGRTILITGANSGLGLASTRALAAKGATVVMACRNEDKAREAMAQVRAETPDARLEFMPLDLASLQSIHGFAEQYRKTHKRLDVLLNNAGVMAIPRRETADGFEMQLGTNHLGHFALTGLLLPLLEHTPRSRIVNVASQAHRSGKMSWNDLQGTRSYSKWARYGQSKLANLLFTYELARRLTAKGSHVQVSVGHPGYSDTNLQFVGPQMEGSSLVERISALGNRLFAMPAEQGALPQLFAATSPDAEHGAYYGPDGFMQMTGWPVKVDSNARSHNEADQARLWEESVKLTGIDFGGL